MNEHEKISLPYLLAGLSRAEFSGSLHLEEGDVDRTIVLSDGLPMQVQSRMQEETLGRLLLQEGKLSSEQYDRMLEEMISTGKPAGEILIKLGILGPHEVFSALEFQTRKKLSNAFRMVDFRFSIIKKPIPLDLLMSKVDMAETILSGLMTCYSVDRILDEFPVHEDTVFMVKKSDQRSPKLSLKELKLLRSLGTGTSLSKLMTAGKDLQYLLAVLYTFHALGVVDASGIDRPYHPELEFDETRNEPTSPSEPEVSGQIEEEFKPPTLANIMQGKIDSTLAEKVLLMGREDYFSLLGVGKQASKQELQQAYRKILSKYKLDRIDSSYSNDQEKELARKLLGRAATALDVLTRNASRRSYAESLDKNAQDKKEATPSRILADVQAHKALEAIQNENWDDAQNRLSRAISMYPKEPSYHFQLGMVGFLRALSQTPKEQKLDDSLKNPFLKALQLDPHYDQPRIYLGYLAKRNGDYKQALLEMQGAIDCNPQNKLARSELRLLRRRIREND